MYSPNLPRELRQQIYLEYFTTPDSTYIFDFPSKKLRMPDNSSISVALSMTCRIIANETRGIALNLNTVTFHPIFSTELRALAFRFGQVFRGLNTQLHSDFENLAHYMDLAKMTEVTNRHPMLIPHMKENSYSLLDQYWPDVPSREYFASRDALRSFLHSQLAENPTEPQPLSRLYRLGMRDAENVNIEAKLAVDLEPWDIPIESELYSIFELATGFPVSPDDDDSDETLEDRIAWYPDRGKYAFSAASAAICFLHSTPLARCHIRNMVIYEDQCSVASPECHALGLISFCQENPDLRIIRRFSIWKTPFVSWNNDLCWESHFPRRQRIDEVELYHMKPIVGAWMAEAGILGSMGMPSGQYTLFLDGDPFRDQTSEIFDQHFQRAAFFHEMMCKAPRPDWRRALQLKELDHYLYENFPQLLQDMVENRDSGLIQCNFDPGSQRWSADEVLATHPEWDANDWEFNLWYWPGGAERLTIPGYSVTQLDYMIDSFREQYPETPPIGSTLSGPPHLVYYFREAEGGEDGEVDNDGHGGSDAHEADI